MSHWPGNEGKMASHSNFKLKFSKNNLDLVRVFFVSVGFDLRSLVTRVNNLVENWSS